VVAGVIQHVINFLSARILRPDRLQHCTIRGGVDGLEVPGDNVHILEIEGASNVEVMTTRVARDFHLYPELYPSIPKNGIMMRMNRVAKIDFFLSAESLLASDKV
jgi:hypothetical protein